jgi:histidinol phosphatase-like enzyme
MYTQFIESDKIKLKSSFFVGDALGRPIIWSNTYKLFGENIGFTIKTPEKNEIPTESTSQELVVLVGYPGSGKSHFTTCLFGKNITYCMGMN